MKRKTCYRITSSLAIAMLTALAMVARFPLVKTTQSVYWNTYIMQPPGVIAQSEGWYARDGELFTDDMWGYPDPLICHSNGESQRVMVLGTANEVRYWIRIDWDSDGNWDDIYSFPEIVTFSGNSWSKTYYGSPEAVTIGGAAASSQPPITTNTMYVEHWGWGPRFGDPVRANDVYSREILFNVYDTLIAMKGENCYIFDPLLSTNVPTRIDLRRTVTGSVINPLDVTGIVLSDGSSIVGWVDNVPDGAIGVGDVLYVQDPDLSCHTLYVDNYVSGSLSTFTLWQGEYDFNIRTSPTINFYDGTGTSSQDTFDESDVQYSLQRGLIQDQDGSPMWTLYKALFDQMNSDRWDTGWPQDAMNLSSLIDNAIKVDTNTHQIMIYVSIPFLDVAFKEILCHTCCSIVSEQYSKSIGCWNGQLYEDTNSNGFPDWFEAPPLGVRRQLSPYDTGSKPIFVGTGPYCVSVYSSALTSVSLTRNTNYWKGWPAAGCNSSVDSVIIDYSAWTGPPTDGLSDGSYDIRDVPRPYIFTYLDSTKNVNPIYPYLKTISKINPVLGLDSLVFNYVVDSSSPYIGTGAFPSGIPTDFFGNPTAGLNIRKAFANALNHSLYLNESFFDEGICRETPAISGLYPDYYNKGPDPPWTYDLSFTNAQSNLSTATAWGGGSVWTQGFTLDIAYASGDDEARIACEMISDFFSTLSTFAGRTGNPFIVNVRPLNLDALLKEFEDGTLPICVMPWHGDYADSDAFFRTFMHSDGYIARFQSYTSTTTGTSTGRTKDVLIDQALKTNPGANQQILYNDLQDIYITDVPSVPIVQPTGRKWLQYWVKGWYYNPLYPGDYYYTMWKADDCWFDATGPTKAVSDGKVDMRDIAYLILHFNAKAPVPGIPPDPKWVAVYGANGCVDPYGDRSSNMKDIANTILHFNHKSNTGTP